MYYAARGDGRVYVRLSEDSSAEPRPVVADIFHIEKQGSDGTRGVIAVSPMLDSVPEAIAGLHVTVLYARTVMRFEGWMLSDTGTTEGVLVEPYLLGTSASEVSGALQDRSYRLMLLGMRNTEVRNYGTLDDHIERMVWMPAVFVTAFRVYLMHVTIPVWCTSEHI